MEADTALRRLGGVASAADLLALTTRGRVHAALRSGKVLRAARGRYVLADTARHRLVAAQVHGVSSHLSAAMHWGWPVKWPPERPWITVPRHRKVAPHVRALAELAYADLAPEELRLGVTSPVRTVLDCARRLPFDEALAVADSALRAGAVTTGDLQAAARAVRGPGSGRCRAVAGAASPLAANPFESVLRAIATTVSGLRVEPQATVHAGGSTYRPDLVDRTHRLAIEADSWEFHTDRRAFGRDCVRYNRLVLAGWLVLRFTWEPVMHAPHQVSSTLSEAVALRGAPPDWQSRR